MLIGNKVDNSSILAGQSVATMAITAAIMHEVLAEFVIAQEAKFQSAAEFTEWYYSTPEATPLSVLGPMLPVWFRTASQAVTIHMLENMMKWLAPKVALIDILCQNAQASIMRQQNQIIQDINRQSH